MGLGNLRRDSATKFHAVCCVATVRSLTNARPALSRHVNGRKRYAEWPGPAPTSARCVPLVSNHVSSSFVRMIAIADSTSKRAAGYANSGRRFVRLYPRAYSRYGSIASSPSKRR